MRNSIYVVCLCKAVKFMADLQITCIDGCLYAISVCKRSHNQLAAQPWKSK